MKPHRCFLLAALLLVWLAGCGPGVGGTGTGESAMTPGAFGAVPSSVCGAPFAAALSCANAALDPALAQSGTRLVRYADTAQGANVQASFEANVLQLDARCLSLLFRGDWGITAGGDSRFWGSYTSAVAADPVPASVSVAPANGTGGADLLIVLREADGRIVLGPVSLQLANTLPAIPAPCP